MIRRGRLQERDALRPIDNNSVVLGFNEAKNDLEKEFDFKLERRFPKNRFGGNCILSRLGYKI